MKKMVFASPLWLMAFVAYSQDVLPITVLDYSQDTASNRGYRVDEVENIQLRDHTQFLTDPAGIISESDKAELNAKILQIRDSTGVEIAVVVLPRIDFGEYADEREFANLLFNEWGIGKKGADNGFLMLFLTDPDVRGITMEVGYGLEGTLTDALCKKIQTRVMIPIMQEGEEAYGRGLIAGINEVGKVADGTSVLIPSNDPIRTAAGAGGGAILLSLIGYAISVRRRSKAYREAVKSFGTTTSDKITYSDGDIRYKCTTVSSWRSVGGSSGSSSGGIGGGSWGGGSGGGISGGSWGGGSSGGGGASTRF